MKLLTLKQFDKAADSTNIATQTRNIAREILVEGRIPAEVARRYGVTRQRAVVAYKRVYREHARLKHRPADWVEVCIFMPSDRAKELKKEMEQLLDELLKKGK